MLLRCKLGYQQASINCSLTRMCLNYNLTTWVLIGELQLQSNTRGVTTAIKQPMSLMHGVSTPTHASLKAVQLCQNHRQQAHRGGTWLAGCALRPLKLGKMVAHTQTELAISRQS
jgi:hypothetical protein